MMVTPHCRWDGCSSEPEEPTASGWQTARGWWSAGLWEPLCIAAHWGQRRRTLHAVRKRRKTKVYCNANQIDRWNPCETPTYACRESTKRSTLNFCDRLRDRFFQITNLGKCLCCASRAEWNQMRRWKEYYEPNEAWREPDCCWKQITSAFFDSTADILNSLWNCLHCLNWQGCI